MSLNKRNLTFSSLDRHNKRRLNQSTEPDIPPNSHDEVVDSKIC